MKQNHSNLLLFANNQTDRVFDKSLVSLIVFLFNSSLEKQMMITFGNKISKGPNDNEYIFNYGNKEYAFSALRDRNLQMVDKKILSNMKSSRKNAPMRTLKLACSMQLQDIKMIIGSSVQGCFDMLISFRENGEVKIIDYANNIVMNKDDYYDLFKFEELNTLSKSDLYKIYYFINMLGNYENTYEYLLFKDEIFQELSNKKDLEWLKEKYAADGTHSSLFSILGDKSDVLYFQNRDYKNSPYQLLRKELSYFTINPVNKRYHIRKYGDAYIFKSKKIGEFKFKLLSDLIDNEKVKKELLSLSRGGHCHFKAIEIANSFQNQDNIFVVGGKIKINDVDYSFHSWVEVADENLVIDYNHNLIMDKDKYYELLGAVPINKSEIAKINEAGQLINETAQLNLHPMYYNYFCDELTKDMLQFR